MTMTIVSDECISCGDCLPVCPTDSVKEGLLAYEIKADTCNECDGYHDEPQCVVICPIDDCITKLN